jgi:2-oxoisovalerate dehydrogenase E1 component
MYGNTTDMPLVARTRVAIGCGYGGQHSMDPAALYALFPGWRMVAPSNAFDYVGLFNSAMQSLDPVLIVEHHSLYGRKFPVPKDDLDYFIPFCKARVTAEGKDVTLITYGSMVGRCEKLQGRLAKEDVLAEIIDLRTIDLLSIDYDVIGCSVAKTGAAAVVEESPRSQSLGGTIAAEVTERFFDQIQGPVLRLNSMDVPNPVSRVLESAAILGDDEIVTAVMSAARRKRNGEYPLEARKQILANDEQAPLHNASLDPSRGRRHDRGC